MIRFLMSVVLAAFITNGAVADQIEEQVFSSLPAGCNAAKRTGEAFVDLEGYLSSLGIDPKEISEIRPRLSRQNDFHRYDIVCFGEEISFEKPLFLKTSKSIDSSMFCSITHNT